MHLPFFELIEINRKLTRHQGRAVPNAKIMPGKSTGLSLFLLIPILG